MVERSLSMREVPGSIPGASILFAIMTYVTTDFFGKYNLAHSPANIGSCLAKAKYTKRLHRPGIEPGPPAWQASILPLNQRCSDNDGGVSFSPP